ncbi:hypothetical protein [Streptomyces sp. NPDC004783]|uniref:hypothetical protein n=1 Tax=Streptomyces sp. NPDC004783 TaxID=3154459 RepID=UPI0033B6FA8B
MNFRFPGCRATDEAAPDEQAAALADLAYDAAAGRLAEQRERLEGLRTRATALLGVTGGVITFATGIGLFGENNGGTRVLPEWCLYSLMGVLLLLGLSVTIVLRPTPDRTDKSWSHGPPTDLLLGGAKAHEDARVVKARAAESMMHAAEDINGPHLRRCGHAYGAAAALLGVELLLVVLGVASVHW